MNVVIKSLFLVFILLGHKVLDLPFFMASDERTSMDFVSKTEVDIWSLSLVLVGVGQKEIGFPFWVSSHEFWFLQETSSGVVFKFDSLGKSNECEIFHFY